MRSIRMRQIDLLRLLNRMNDYIEGFRMTGSIRIDDKDIYDRRIHVEELRKNVGMVFQKPNISQIVYEKCDLRLAHTGHQ